jgi:DNA repair exonuclease SbcCD nuclease subunit
MARVSSPDSESPRMRLVVSSDYHLDHVTRGIARFAEIERAVRRTVQVAIEREADAWIFLGDAMDPDSGSCVFRCARVLVSVAAELAEHDIRSIWIAGNHDVIEASGMGTTLSPLRNLHPLVHVFEEPGALMVSDRRFVALPFTSTDRTYDPATVAREMAVKKGDIVLSHLSVPGIIPGEETHEMPRGKDILYPFAETVEASWRLQGHYHRPQEFRPREGGSPIVIPGSLARLTFGEEKNDPSFLCFEA